MVMENHLVVLLLSVVILIGAFYGYTVEQKIFQIKNDLLKHEKEIKEVEEVKDDLESTKQELKQLKVELKAMHTDLTEVELESTKNEVKQVELELGSTRKELKQVNVELESKKNEVTQVKVELDTTKNEVKKVKAELDKIKTGVCFYGDTADRVLNLMAADGNRKPDFKPKDCKYLNRKHAQSGIYKIYPDENEPQSVYCDMETDGGGWTVIVRRVDGSENFNRNWHTYERGFGNLKREFWIGNSLLHSLTTNGNCEVRVDLTNFKGEKRFAKYSSFAVGNSASKYKLSVGGYSGNAGDSLSKHNGFAFSTSDSDNDTWLKGNCAATSGWWYYACDNVSLTKSYNKKSSPIEWEEWKGSEFSIKYAVMMTRPK